jgi:hypothetical protein
MRSEYLSGASTRYWEDENIVGDSFKFKRIENFLR